MQNKIDVNEIVKIEQMPKVFSQLEMIGTFIDEKIKDIDTLDCTEENKQEVKQRRTEINNILKELDDRRKFIKNKILLNTREFLCYYRKALVFFIAGVILTQGIPVPVHTLYVVPVRTCGG